MKRRCVNGDEQDAFTGWRRVMHWRPGQRKRLKRQANRRERRKSKTWINQFVDEYDDLENDCRG